MSDEAFSELWRACAFDLTSGSSWDSDELDRRWALDREIARRTEEHDAE